MLTTARNRAKTKGLPFDLTEDDIDIPVFCPVLGIKLERGVEGTGRSDASPSLDRIVPERGYVKGNVVVVSNRANRMKNDGSPEELRRLAHFYTQLSEELCLTPTAKTGKIGSKQSTDSLPPKQKQKTKRTSPSLSPHHRSMNVLLIDGDIFAYKASFGNEEAYDLGDGIINLSANLPEAERSVEHLIEDVADKLNAKKIIVALSHDENFRKDIFTTYKANRKVVRKPLALGHIKRHIAKTWDTRIKDRLEADDVLGIMLTHPKLFKGLKPIVVSIDKDLLQIPGRHYNPDKDLKRVVDAEQGDRQFYLQVLTGDSVDNYPGCPGIGAKRAPLILDGEGEPWPAIVAAYENKGLSGDDALVQARVARILRHSDYDFKRKEPILWTP